MPNHTYFQECCGARIMYQLNEKPNLPGFLRVRDAALAARNGVVVFIDNAVKRLLSYLDPKTNKYTQGTEAENGGEAWCKFIRDQGYRCDSIWMGGNPNHQEQEPHILTMYIWYINSQRDTESVTIGKQQKRKPKPEIGKNVSGPGLGAIFSTLSGTWG